MPSGPGFANSQNPLAGTTEKPCSDRDYVGGVSVSEDGFLKDSEAPEAHSQGQVGCNGWQVSIFGFSPWSPANTQA